jgi:dTDP-4-dehydrorhamnose 3,5-epimerase
MSFQFTRLSIPDVVLIQPSVYQDERGFFLESYKHSAFSANGISDFFVQENRSLSARGVLRGLHYQRSPKAQGKLVQAIQGTIFDVVVDLRHASPAYGQWVGVTLDAGKKEALFVPVGFAHGFCVISETAEVHYKVTGEYSPHDEAGILWNDPDLGIAWPLTDPVLSKRDTAWPRLKEVDASGLF